MIQKNLYVNSSTWEEAYKKFDKRVEDFFSTKEDGRLLRINITKGEGWEKICPFLDCKIPDRPFPHANRSGTASPWKN